MARTLGVCAALLLAVGACKKGGEEEAQAKNTLTISGADAIKDGGDVDIEVSLAAPSGGEGVHLSLPV